MKKTNKSLPPNELTAFEQAHPAANWNDFRNNSSGEGYKALKSRIIDDQGGLCAYCEQTIRDKPVSSQRLEHFHSKSDRNEPTVNWALDWDNIIAVCLGGSAAANDKQRRYPTPANLSCDASKAHFQDCGRIPVANEGYVLNPLGMPLAPSLFVFDKATGQLHTDHAACRVADYQGPNVHSSLGKLVDKTIEVFNLNCQRLCDDRLEVLKYYNQKMTAARKLNNRYILKQLSQRWFSTAWPSFFTTRRALLGRHAEDYLAPVHYSG